ncbi:MAG TPA: RodZ domain-containing protein [Acidimicrobiales bacterium]
MWIVLAAVAVIAVAAGIVLVFRRPEGNDIDSVRSYHSALGTLEHLSEHPPRSTVNVGSEDRATVEPGVPRSYRRPVAAAPAATPDPGPSVPPIPVRGNDEFPDPETPLIFDDSRPRDRYRRDVSGESVPVSRMDRAQRHALDSMNHRPRRITTVMIVVVALVLFGALAYAGSKRSSPPHSRATTASTTTRSSHPASTGARSAPAGHSTTTTTTRTTPTTQPKQVVALTSTSTSATYPVNNAAYKVTVTASGTCWVAVTSSSSGSTLWAGELQAGSVQVVPATGTVTVQMGTPSVTLAIDKVPVVFPTPVRSPFEATFQPTAAALAVAGAAAAQGSGSSTSSGTSTTTTTTTGSTTTSSTSAP